MRLRVPLPTLRDGYFVVPMSMTAHNRLFLGKPNCLISVPLSQALADTYIG